MQAEMPSTGTRISHSGSLGTVRYVGPVDGTNGLWLGVEWDDQIRGKHDGIKDGKRYFTCIVPNSGSFIRPSSAISYGVSFLTALAAKYIELPHGSGLEKVVLGSSDGAIEVEVVGLDKIRNNLARLERLRQVSLDNELVSTADPPGQIRRTCTGIRGLDLSRNLISGWDTVAAITIELQNLQSLCLNQNRFRSPKDLHFDATAFLCLEELQLSATLTTWNTFQILLPHMPALRIVELGYNRLQVLSSETNLDSRWRKNVTLHSVNFDGNGLDSFADISSAMRNLSGLSRLILTSNHVTQIIPPPTEGSCESAGTTPVSPLRELKHLALAFNRISTWYDIDILQRWCPDLESLTLAGNPLIDDPRHASYARAFTIAKIPSLTSLDGAAISARERTDSELLYLSHISKQTFESPEAKRDAHPQFDALCSKHGVTDAQAVPEAQDTLSNRLITIHIRHVAHTPPTNLSSDKLESYLGQSDALITLHVLSTMTVRTLRLKLIKSLKVPKTQHNNVRLWIVLPNGQLVELDEEYTGRDLGYWGVDDGTQLVLVNS
ncbi:hypothetical protein C8Q74DRAFT_81996 [Fomes fomentarius]|nr:hypothetical protein C8Q74DRAFT_81996 [Fomes fomentarius]